MSAPALSSSLNSTRSTSPTNNIAYCEPVITFEEWEERKKFSGFGREDENILRELHLVARTYADEVMEQLYERWLQFPELRSFFQDEQTLKRVKGLQKQYFIRLTSGEYNMEYLEDRLRIGRTHRHIGLAPRWYMGAYSIYMQIVFPRVLAAFEYNREKRNQAINALTKIISIDQELALLSYFGMHYTNPPEKQPSSPIPSSPATITPPRTPPSLSSTPSVNNYTTTTTATSTTSNTNLNNLNTT